MFRHFESLSLTLSDLRAKYGGQSGVWQAFAAPSRDETGYQVPLGYYEGSFEDVLTSVMLQHRRLFLDDNFCGEIIPIVPQHVAPSQPRPPGVSVLSLLYRALEALDAVPTEAAHAEAEAIRTTVGAMESAILAEVAILKASGDVPPPVLEALFSYSVPQVGAWARAVFNALAAERRSKSPGPGVPKS